MVLGVVKKKMPASFFTLHVALEQSGVSTVRIEVGDFNASKGLGIDVVEQLDTSIKSVKAPKELFKIAFNFTVLFRWP
jgi:hypothetical protein